MKFPTSSVQGGLGRPFLCASGYGRRLTISLRQTEEGTSPGEGKWSVLYGAPSNLFAMG